MITGNTFDGRIRFFYNYRPPGRSNGWKPLIYLAAVLLALWAIGTIRAQEPPFAVLPQEKQAGEIQRKVVPRDTLIKVAYDAGWRLAIHRLEKNVLLPVTLYDCDCHNTITFTGPPGDYAITAFDANSPNIFIQYIVISSNTPIPPGPDPPDPDPDPPIPPDPDPPGPVPDTVPNIYGLGHIAYLKAIAVGDRQQAASLALAYRNAMELLAKDGNLPAAQTNVRNARISLGPKWDPLEAELEPALQKAIESYGNSNAAWYRYLYEIAKGIAVAAEARQSPALHNQLKIEAVNP